MITDDQMIAALKTVRQYCKEQDYCKKCPYNNYCEHCPFYWELPGDDDEDVELIADIGELNENDE